MTLLTAPQIAAPRTGERRWLDLVGAVCAALGAVALLAEYGFNDPPVPVYACWLAEGAAVAAFLGSRVVGLRGAVYKAGFLRRYWLDLALVPGAGVVAAVWGTGSGAGPEAGVILAAVRQAGLAALAATQAGAIYVAIRQAGLVALAIAGRAAGCVVRPVSRGRCIRLMLGWYLGLIVVGGLLLALPKATTADHRNSPNTHLLNSAFAATSAACTAGLNVYEMPADYTLFGQIVILVLIQAGGLGMLVVGTLFGMLVVRELSGEPGGTAWMDAGRARRIIGAIVGTAVALEAAGAVLLWPVWADEPTVFSRGFHAVFGAVGAFCNTGFTLQKDSLVGVSGFWQVYGVILPLSVLGGLGFPVLYEIVHRVRGRGAGEGALLPLPARGWSVHTRLAVATSLCLVMAGTVGLLLFETPGRIGYWYVGRGNLLSQQNATQLSPEWMRSHEGPQRLYDAVFLATAGPGAGLRTVPVDPGAMSPASEFLLMLLMLVGGGPASTAGGIKTVALAVLVLYGCSVLRGRRRVEAFGWEISAGVVRRVLGLLLAAGAWLMVTILVLAHIERATFLAVAFEAVSALSTNGLSLGLTAGLTAGGKGMVIFTMLAGKLGPLGLMVWLAGRDEGGEPGVSEGIVLG